MIKRKFNDLTLKEQKKILYLLVLENGAETLGELPEHIWVNKTHQIIDMIYRLTEPTTIEEFTKILQTN